MAVDTETISIMSLLGIFSVAGTLGNFLVLYIYSRKRDKTTSTIFILTLSGTDFFTCLVIIPYTIVTLSLENRLGQDFFCRLYMFFITCNVPFSAFVMVAIAIDRYLCICHPFLRAFNIPRAKIVVMILMVFAVVLGILTALQHKIYIPKAVQIVPTDDVINQSSIFNTTGEITWNISSHSNYHVLSNSKPNVNDSKHNYSVLNKNNSTGVRNDSTDLHIKGACIASNSIFGEEFIHIYQKFYSCLYLIAFVIVLILYGLIYRVIHQRRANKAKRRKSGLFPVKSPPPEISMAEETQMTIINGKDDVNGKTNEDDIPEQRVMKRKHPGLKEKNFYANIRTAAMLFVVTIVFLFAFLPAWLMALNVVPYSVFIFYMYFVYNVCNPIIYAFMNQGFRSDLRNLFCK